MGKSGGIWVFLTLALVLTTIGTPFADTRSVPSADRLPLEHWAYDAMLNLAADNLISGLPARLFAGDRLFNRLEMAEIVASAVDNALERKLSASQVALITKLIEEFRPEIAFQNAVVLEKWSNREESGSPNSMVLTGYVRGVAEDDSGGDSLLLIPYRVSALANFSEDMLGACTLSEREDKFFLQRRNDPQPGKIMIKGYGEDFTWEIGRDYFWWGPCYASSLILSDNSAGFWNAGGSKEFSFGPFFGRVKISQFASAFEDEGQTLYLFGRRYERTLSHGWNIGISETAKTGKMPNPLILVLPFYLYQHLFHEVDEEFNTLYSIDFLYAARPSYQIYGELLIDDITSPRIFGGGFERPRKTGWTLGVYLPRMLSKNKLSTFRAEYIYIDRLTYGATREDYPLLAYIHNTEVIGHAIGPNSKALYLRWERSLAEKLSVICEYLDRHEVEAQNPRRNNERAVSFLFTYDISPDKSIGVRLAPYTIRMPDGSRNSGTIYQIRATAAF
ncbi:MAG: capsule assembly Wzi family protein [Armatimonadota bacterium]|nr:capsule assembly Wzi family protein [Armatimonadota bacterium]